MMLSDEGGHADTVSPWYVREHEGSLGQVLISDVQIARCAFAGIVSYEPVGRLAPATADDRSARRRRSRPACAQPREQSRHPRYCKRRLAPDGDLVELIVDVVAGQSGVTGRVREG